MENFHWLSFFVLLALLIAVLLILIRNVKLKGQLQNEIREKQQILSIVSHDIRSPFNRISALEQLIAMDENKLSVAQTDFLNKIHQVVADGLALIRNLVDYRNLQYRKVKVLPEKIDLTNLIHTAVVNHTSLAEKKQLTFECDLEKDLQIVSDSRLVSRAVDNVLSNAIKFSPPEKKIQVRLHNSENSHVQIEIRDEAPGFTRDDFEKIFNKFQKLSAKPTAGESTTGLGLYITKSMLERIKGEVHCATQEGMGSTFVIRLPHSME